VFIDDRQDLDRPPVGGYIELEVHRPHPIGRIGDHLKRRGGTAAAHPSSPLRNPQPFLPPKPLHLIVIDDPAISASVVVSGPEPRRG